MQICSYCTSYTDHRTSISNFRTSWIRLHISLVPYSESCTSFPHLLLLATYKLQYTRIQLLSADFVLYKGWPSVPCMGVTESGLYSHKGVRRGKSGFLREFCTATKDCPVNHRRSQLVNKYFCWWNAPTSLHPDMDNSILTFVKCISYFSPGLDN